MSTNTDWKYDRNNALFSTVILNHYVQIQEKVKTNYLKTITFVIEAK